MKLIFVAADLRRLKLIRRAELQTPAPAVTAKRFFQPT
jgi:hypothetical protein